MKAGVVVRFMGAMLLAGKMEEGVMGQRMQAAFRTWIKHGSQVPPPPPRASIGTQLGQHLDFSQIQPMSDF